MRFQNETALSPLRAPSSGFAVICAQCFRPSILILVCSGNTALMVAAEAGNYAACDFLLKSGSRVNAYNNA
jgi:hypothetical protein